MARGEWASCQERPAGDAAGTILRKYESGCCLADFEMMVIRSVHFREANINGAVGPVP